MTNLALRIITIVGGIIAIVFLGLLVSIAAEIIEIVKIVGAF
jgi:hypothetical protein